ncbi:MAG: bifunctional phosphopantothenoylcysteine decarboxylase/phosphopantothenate--cysteine ligase CoaBC [bacterium]|nr:bifunctional phosphopantothenoylcysteine decarboxylase/phosphopantothenate--cysteine ligase CoaBC [bacterium]
MSGSVAAYKALELVRRLREQAFGVQVILTAGAQRFVTPLSFQALSGREVKTELFDLGSEAKIGHIDLARKADLILVAPATADLMAKAALGLADDYASTLLLATQSPQLWAPAMNHAMWSHPATQQNAATLKTRGATIVGPDSGDLACGEEGPGRLTSTENILAALQSMTAAKGPLSGKQVLVTAGPTREKIDAARYISNHSSGKMGFALAQAAQALGAQVTLVTGPVALSTPPGVQRVDVVTAQEMMEAVLQHFETSDLTIKCAAVGDYRLKNPVDTKLKKAEDFSLDLTLNEDILARLGQLKREDQVLVGFAAETGDLAHWAHSKRQRKAADWIVANDVSLADTGFDGDQNQVLVAHEKGEFELGPMAKSELARQLLTRLLEDPKLGPKLRQN